MGELTFIGIFLAGIFSFISPCVLPLVPPYLTYLAGASIDDMTANADGTATIGAGVRQRAFINALLFVMGFSVVFISLGAGASTIGLFVRAHLTTLAFIAGIVIILMGCHFLGLFRIGLFYREARIQLSNETIRGAGFGGSFLMGLAFAFGWTPCIGPVLGAVLGVASARDSVSEGALMLAVYSAGLGVPFLLAAFFVGPFMEFLSRFKRHLGIVEKVMGVLLILTGILFLTGGMETMAYSLLEMFPFLQTVG